MGAQSSTDTKRAAAAKQTPEPKAAKVETQSSQRFAADDAKAYEYLRAHGYVVIRDVLGGGADGKTPAAAVLHARELLWQYLERASPKLKRYEPDTWDDGWPGSATVGIVATHGIGQSDFLWYLRRQPAVRAVFARVWECDPKELLTSFDGCGVFRPWNIREEWKTHGSWYHVDQNPRNKPGLHCVQGLVSLYDQDHSTGGLVVLPGSHTRQAQLLDVPARGDFVPIPRAHPELNHRAVLVDCKAGDLVLWDSRTVHCNSPALTDKHKDTALPDAEVEVSSAPATATATGAAATTAGDAAGSGSGSGGSGSGSGGATKVRVTGRHDLLRAAGYVCMTPLRMCTDPDVIIPQRLHAFLRRQTTSHWPNEFRPTEQGLDPGKGPAPVQLTDDEFLLVTGGWKPPTKAKPKSQPKPDTENESAAAAAAAAAPAPAADSDTAKAGGQNVPLAP